MKGDLSYEDVMTRIVQYSRLKPELLYKVYCYFIPDSWRSPTPDRMTMLKHLYRFLMQAVVDTDVDALFIWYYKRMTGGKDIDPKTYLRLRRGIEQAFAAVTPPPRAIDFDSILEEAVFRQVPTQKAPPFSGFDLATKG